MYKYSRIIQSTIIALGLLALGLCIKGGFDNFTNKDRRVTVKGLAEKTVEADKVTWTLGLSKQGNEIHTLAQSVNADIKKIKAFFIRQQLQDKGKIQISTLTISNNMDNYYGNNRPEYKYTITQSISITTTDTRKVNKVMDKRDELINEGIITSSDYADFSYTKFQQLKPEMMRMAIKNAEITAKQFATNSNSKLSKILEAGQGEFSIDEGDAPYMKKIRVVSTITYSLKD